MFRRVAQFDIISRIFSVCLMGIVLFLTNNLVIIIFSYFQDYLLPTSILINMLDRLLEQSESTNKEERTNEYEYFYKRNKNKMYFTI